MLYGTKFDALTPFCGKLKMAAKVTKIFCRDFSSWISGRKIPNKVHRNSTDILNALSTVIGHDATGNQYKYYDDPFLIPTSNGEKRVYSLSQEAGRKAARWIRQEHFDIFQHAIAQPPIRAFVPMTKDSNLFNLRQKLAEKKISTALYIYKTMKKSSEELPSDLKRDILEIVCYLNEEEMLPNDFIEERWFSQRQYNKNDIRQLWIDNGLADQLFTELPKDSHTYNCMIQGMCKHLQVKRAYALYSEALNQNMDVDVNTFNAIIREANRIKETNDQKWDFVLITLQTMANKHLKPNKETLNSILALISTINNSKFAKNLVLQTLAEFDQIGIRPCLEGWNNILNIFCKTRGPLSYGLLDVLDIIEADAIQLNSKADAQFFNSAIIICCNYLNDLQMAKRIYKLVENYNFCFGDVNNENLFYRNYLSILLANETPEEFMKAYHNLVPSVVIPESGLMLEIIKFIQLHESYDLLLQIWSDIVAFDYGNREDIVKLILQILVKEISQKDGDQLKQHCGGIGWNIWTNMQKLEKLSELGVNSIEDIMILLCHSGNFNGAVEIFTVLCKNSDMDDLPAFESIKHFLKLALEVQQVEKAIECLQFCLQNNIAEAQKLQEMFDNASYLTEKQQLKIASLINRN